jgi:hypothetical protein
VRDEEATSERCRSEEEQKMMWGIYFPTNILAAEMLAIGAL